ncbi:MAG: transporter substrate-binding domain-containing protein [Methylocystaceae bacterium]|nr:transporter substrate-binding domain-containing protein [Methylocystaceae bacterium]
MKVFIIPLVALVMAVFVFMDARADDLKVNYADVYPPLSFGKMHDVHGVLPDLVHEIIEVEMGQAVSHQGKAWKRAQAEVWHGEADALVTSPNPERSRHAYISKLPVFQLAFRPYTRKFSRAYEAFKAATDLSGLEGLRFCDVHGNGWAAHFYKKHNISYHLTRSFDVCLGMLAIGRTDVVIHADFIIRELLRKISLVEHIYEHDLIFPESPNFHLMVSKKSDFGQEFLMSFDQTLENMKLSGRYDEIVARAVQAYGANQTAD